MEINELNNFIHENLVNRRNSTPYGLLRDIAKAITFGIKIPDRSFPAIKQTMEINQSIQIALDFFKSVDEELYQKAKAILERRSGFEFNIYYKEEVTPRDMDTKRKDGMPKYTSQGCVYSTNGKKGVYVPCERTIVDVFILVHEISHTLDYCEPDTPARGMLGEVTSYTFEAMLQQYLLEHNLISREDAIAIEKSNIISHYDDGVETYAKLMLMDIKESRGRNEKITEQDIANLQKQYNISDRTFNFIINRMMGKKAVPAVDYRARYMTAQLIYPYIMEQYYSDPAGTIEKLKEYFKAINRNDFNEALLALGIEPKNESLQMLIDCNNRRIERLYKTRLFDEQEKTANLKKDEPFFEQNSSSSAGEEPPGEEPGDD